MQKKATGTATDNKMKKIIRLIAYSSKVLRSPKDITLSASTIAENEDINTVVGELSTIDFTPSDSFTYTLVEGDGDDDNASFNISDANLRTSEVFDYDTKSEYLIRIRTTDSDDLYFEKAFVITVTNENEAPTDITLSADTIAEGVAVNTVVGSFSTTDPDMESTFTYTLVEGDDDDDNDSFNIAGNDLRSSEEFDYSTKLSYKIRVRTTDQDDLYFEKTFTITVTGVVIPAVIYYVDATGGDDEADGLSEENAWKTITKVNAATLLSGESVLFKCGETFSGQLAPTDSGVSGSPITFGSYGTGAKPIITAPATCSFYLNDDYHHLWIEGIDFSGSAGSYSTIYCYDAHDIYFKDCIARDAGARHGISCNGSAHTVYNITFDGCEMKDNAKSGTYTGTLTSHDILFTNCTAHDNGSNADADHGFYIGGGVICDGCTAYDNSGGGFKMNDNEVQPYQYPITRNCVSHGNNYGIIFTHKNALAHDNLVYGSLTANILVYGNTWGGYKAYFNTLVNAVSASYRGSFLFTAGLSPSCDFRNNLLIQDAAVVTKANLHFDGALGMASYDDAFDYNVYYYSSSSPTTQSIIWDGSLAATKNWTNWRAAGAEAHGTLLTSTPDFVTRYTDCHPADAGDLKGKGVAISGYGTDKDGNARADPPTPGCYEEAAA